MSKKKKKHKKRSAVLPYFVNPVIYVLIALIVAVPVSLGVFNVVKNYVHKAQNRLSIGIEEYGVRSEGYENSDASVGTVTLPVVRVNHKMGELTCEDAGISCDVYYCSNYVTRRSGAAMFSDSAFPGENGVCEIRGNRQTYFKGLKNVKKGDRITLRTPWGTYVYIVSAVTVSDTAPSATMPQCLLLRCSEDDRVYSNLSPEKLYVLAECESGPQAEEVQHEQ